MSTRCLIKDMTLSDLLDLELTMWTKVMLSVFINNYLAANCSDHHHIATKIGMVSAQLYVPYTRPN